MIKKGPTPKTRLLIIGQEPSDFFTPIANYLNDNNFEVGIIEYKKHSKKLSSDIYKLKINGNNFSNISIYGLGKLIQSFISPYFWNQLFTLKSVKKALRNWLVKTELLPIFNSYDIINFHSIDPHSIYLSKFISNQQKCIYSFWGTDLFTPNKNITKIQATQIYNVDAISLHSTEMKNKALELFPQIDSSIIYKQLFGLGNNFFTLFEDLQTSLDLNEFKERIGIPTDKIIITIGYSARPVCNHLEIINYLKALDSNLLDQIHLLIPMNYGVNLSYIETLNECLKNVTQISYSSVNEYLSYSDLIALRMSSDIFIHGNLSDAFSNSMLEYISTNNICLIGDWLPYSRLAEVGVLYKKFSAVNELGVLLEETIINISTLKLEFSTNYNVVKSNFSSEAVLPDWKSMYTEVLKTT